MRPRPTAMVVGVAGLVGALVVARGAAMGEGDLAALLAWALGTALVGGLLMAWAVRRARRRSVVVQLALLTSGTATVVSVGAWLGARAMFYSAHDLSALSVLLLAAGTAGAVVAILAGEHLARSTDQLVELAREIGAGSTSGHPLGAANAELSRLGRELELTSERLDQARRREQLVEQSRRELVAWVSHDLRTPLAGLRAMTEALEDGLADDPATVARYHRAMHNEVDQLAGLIDDLFELSRAQAGAIRLELERLSLTDLVSDAIAGLAPVAASRGVRLEGRIGSSGTDLTGSAPELTRALRNILENAVRHTPADGSVVVEVGRDGEDAFVSVADGGGGVPDEELPRIFDAGFRGDPARSPGGGAGLGLAIARSFVEAHHGRITISNEDRGARFTVWLPLDHGS